ncbi:unnamed protein product [Lampetra planeri]
MPEEVRGFPIWPRWRLEPTRLQRPSALSVKRPLLLGSKLCPALSQQKQLLVVHGVTIVDAEGAEAIEKGGEHLGAQLPLSRIERATAERVGPTSSDPARRVALKGQVSRLSGLHASSAQDMQFGGPLTVHRSYCCGVVAVDQD